MFAQDINKHIVVGPTLNISLSDKLNPRIGLYSQFYWQVNKNNSIVAGLTNTRFLIKQFGGGSITTVTAGWRYLIIPDKLYVNFIAGIAQEIYLLKYYTNKALTFHPVIELASGFYIPFKGYRIDIGLGYNQFFSKYKFFSWLQLKTGIRFSIKKKSKKKTSGEGEKVN